MCSTVGRGQLRRALGHGVQQPPNHLPARAQLQQQPQWPPTASMAWALERMPVQHWQGRNRSSSKVLQWGQGPTVGRRIAYRRDQQQREGHHVYHVSTEGGGCTCAHHTARHPPTAWRVTTGAAAATTHCRLNEALEEARVGRRMANGRNRTGARGITYQWEERLHCLCYSPTATNSATGAMNSPTRRNLHAFTSVT